MEQGNREKYLKIRFKIKINRNTRKRDVLVSISFQQIVRRTMYILRLIYKCCQLSVSPQQQGSIFRFRRSYGLVFTILPHYNNIVSSRSCLFAFRRQVLKVFDFSTGTFAFLVVCCCKNFILLSPAFSEKKQIFDFCIFIYIYIYLFYNLFIHEQKTNQEEQWRIVLFQISSIRYSQIDILLWYRNIILVNLILQSKVRPTALPGILIKTEFNDIRYVFEFNIYR